MSVLIYREAFQFRNMGYASALAWFLLLIILVLTLLIFRSSAAWVHYEGAKR
jgi:multiple sugar transport system permease protein